MRLLSYLNDFYVFALFPLFGHLSRKTRDHVMVDRQLAALTVADCRSVPMLLLLVGYLPYFGLDAPLQPYPRLEAGLLEAVSSKSKSLRGR